MKIKHGRYRVAATFQNKNTKETTQRETVAWVKTKNQLEHFLSGFLAGIQTSLGDDWEWTRHEWKGDV